MEFSRAKNSTVIDDLIKMKTKSNTCLIHTWKVKLNVTLRTHIHWIKCLTYFCKNIRFPHIKSVCRSKGTGNAKCQRSRYSYNDNVAQKVYNVTMGRSSTGSVSASAQLSVWLALNAFVENVTFTNTTQSTVVSKAEFIINVVYTGRGVINAFSFVNVARNIVVHGYACVPDVRLQAVERTVFHFTLLPTVQLDSAQYFHQ